MVSPYARYGRLTFPEVHIVKLVTNETYTNPEKENANLTKQFNGLVSVGLLEVKDGTGEAYNRNRKITVPTKEYILTSKGKDAYKEHRKKGFCVATKKVSEIINFTEPSPAMMGMTMSKVNYTFSPDDLTDWANNPAITEAFPRLARELEANQPGSDMLILMNDGWVHSSEAKL